MALAPLQPGTSVQSQPSQTKEPVDSAAGQAQGNEGWTKPPVSSTDESSFEVSGNVSTGGKDGLEQVKAVGALKVLLGDAVKVDANSGVVLSLKGTSPTVEQFQAAVKTVFGAEHAKFQGDGSIVMIPGQGASARLAADFQVLRSNLKVSGNTSMELKDTGKAVEVSQSLKALTKDGSIVSSGRVVLKDRRFDSAKVNAQVKREFGDGASIESTIDATIDAEGKAKSTVRLAAFKRLKEMSGGKGDAMTLKGDGSFEIKDKAIDRGEVAALVSIVADKQASIDSGGRIVYADGMLRPELNTDLKVAWDNTRLEASGALKVNKNGKTEVVGTVGAFFDTEKLKAGAELKIDGDDAMVQLTLAAKGSVGKIDGKGQLILNKGHIDKANFSSNLVVGSADASLGIHYTDTSNDKQLGGKVGVHHSGNGAGIGVLEEVSIFHPASNDQERLKIEKAGGVWAKRVSSIEGDVAVSASGSMNVAGVKVGLGFTADAGKKKRVELISVHPSKDDALDSSLTSLQIPQTVEDVMRMRPHERVSVSGEQTIGFGGEVNVGLGMPGVGVTVGGQVYHQVTADMSRDIRRLAGDKVRVRFTRESGVKDVKTFNATLGLDDSAPKIAAALGQAGFKKSLEETISGTAVFDLTVDVSTPYGKKALEHLLKGDLSEAQYWAAFADSGVVLNDSVSTQVQATVRSETLNLANLSGTSSARELKQAVEKLGALDFTYEAAIDYANEQEAMLPWGGVSKTQVRYIHETKASAKELPPLDALEISNELQLRAPVPKPETTLANSRATLVLRARFGEKVASPSKLGQLAEQAKEMLEQVGFGPDEMIRFSNLDAAIDLGLLKRDDSFWGLKEQVAGLGAATFDFEGFVSPAAFDTIFYGPGGRGHRAERAFEQAYLDASAIAPGGSTSVLSQKGLKQAIESHLDVSLIANSDRRSFKVVSRANQSELGTLTLKDLDVLRDQIIATDVSTFGNTKSQPVGENVGTWIGSSPASLVTLTRDQAQQNAEVLKPARRFAQSMVRAAELYTENVPPQKRSTETLEGYQKRLADWESTEKHPLFNKPDEFYMHVMDHAQNGIGDDPVAAYAMLQLARKDGVFALANFEVDQDLIVKMEAQGAANVRHFGAASLIASMGLSRKQGGYQLTNMSDREIADRAFKEILGPNASVDENGRVTAPQFPQEMYELLKKGREPDGSIGVPAGARTQSILQTFGPSAIVKEGRIVFDNRGYAFVNLGRALADLGPASFGEFDAKTQAPPLFPTLEPHSTPDELANTYRVAARHKGRDVRRLRDFYNAHARTYEDLGHHQKQKSDFAW